jgi:transposase-like protein
MTSTRCGISAKQLEREIGVTYKTAWRMFHLIRNELMEQDDDQLDGVVEVDEMFVGGKRKDTRGRSPKGPKIPVLGMVQRGGRVKAVVISDTTALTMYPHIRKQVRTGSEVFTDAYSPYNALHKSGFVHETINHDLGIFVTGNVHTQTIEGFWALVKRGIGGVYHAVSAKHLQSYLSEYVFRYNHRNEPRAMFLTLLLKAARP